MNPGGNTMNRLPPAMPSNPTDTQDGSRSARWTAGFLVALGFGFMGSALIDASEPTGRPSSFSPEAAAPTFLDTGAASVVAGESREVEAAVRNWQWEAQGQASERKPVGRYDFEELWLAR
jgi:hypothetical protein